MTPLTIIEKVELLYQDILNVPSHVFGEHKNCKKLNWPCRGLNLLGEENVMPILRNTDAYSKICEGLRYLGRYAENLLYKVTTNAVESANNVICKLISGKRICYNMRDSYTLRCHAAATQFTTKKFYQRFTKGLARKCLKLLKQWKIVEN